MAKSQVLLDSYELNLYRKLTIQIHFIRYWSWIIVKIIFFATRIILF